jgi:hypothetical protein
MSPPAPHRTADRHYPINIDTFVAQQTDSVVIVNIALTVAKMQRKEMRCPK